MKGVALVTGGGRGLGRAFAIGLAKAGMRVAVLARTAAQIEETSAVIAAAGGASLAVVANVTDQAAVVQAVAGVEAGLGPIDLLVNNAGSGPPFGPTWEANPAEWWRTVETNLKGPMLCCHAVLPSMIARERGRIVNVCSGAGTISIPYLSAYITSKAALIRLSEVLADEARPHGISVFAMQPGTVRTAMAEDLMRSQTGQKWLPWFGQIFTAGHDESSQPGTDLVLFLASGQADNLSGRYFAAPGDPAEAMAQNERIRKQDLRLLRMRLD